MSDNALRRLREKVDRIVKLEKELLPQIGLRGDPLVEDVWLRLQASIWVEAVMAAYSVTVELPTAQKDL